MTAWVRDLETLSELTVGVYTHYKTAETKVFIIHPLKNDFEQWLNFLENCADNGDTLIGFNSLGFDSQIEQAMLSKRNGLEKLSAAQICRKIADKAQKVINDQEYGDNKFSGLPEWQLSIPQIDIFKVWHFDNPARKSSLKWLQFTQDWHSVQEMPIHHTDPIDSWEKINMVVEYCKNDVNFTKFLYEKTIPMLQVRRDIQKKYKINCINFSDAKLGSELLLKMYCKKTKKKKFDVKGNGTPRHSIKVSEIIFPYVKFETDDFNHVLKAYNDTVITATKGEVKYAVKFKGYKFDYGAGGIHQCAPGIYKSDDLYIILDIDVAGLYPTIGCENLLYPAHLGPEFYEVYKGEIVDVRMREKAKGKDGDKTIVAGYKLAANASVGNTNQKHSWLYDPQYNMTITINGQLMISMLVEQLIKGLSHVELIQTNTDGATMRVLRSEVDKHMEICRAWEKTTRLTLEFAEVKQMFAPDVNNYLCEYVGGKLKAKGRFEYENLEPHKNKSFLVVSKAIKEYLINGTLPEDYLKSNKNIMDYCGGARSNGAWQFMGTCMENGEVTETPMHKVVRFYISNTGCKIIKVNQEDGRRISTIAGAWLQTEYNFHSDHIPWENYNINYQFYLDQIYKEIGSLTAGQTSQIEIDFPI